MRDIYTWDAHVRRYLKVVAQILRRGRKRRRRERVSDPFRRDVRRSCIARGCWCATWTAPCWATGPPWSGSWTGSGPSGGTLAFGVATGRKLDSAQYILREWGMPAPDVVISGIGTEIRYGCNAHRDLGWEEHIRQGWRREDLAAALKDVPGLALQGRRAQGPFKLSYNVGRAGCPGWRPSQEVIHRAGLQANLVYSQSRHLDVLPHRRLQGPGGALPGLQVGDPPGPRS